MRIELDPNIETYKTRITYVEGSDIVRIEHFNEKDKVISELFMDYEDAYSYARLITDVADKVIGVE